jgi:raffinose/stachyose/melibiose transport system permease protein
MKKPGKFKIRIPYHAGILHAVLIVYALFCLYPIYFSFISSLKKNDEIFATPFRIPTGFNWKNYETALELGNFLLYFWNTLVLAGGTVILSALVSAFAAYPLAKFRFRFQGATLIYFVSGLMIPIQAVIVPLAYIFGQFRWNDNYLILILLFTAFMIPMSVFILAGFAKSIPDELEEAAVIDGCGHWRAFWHVVFPLMMPGIATASTFNFIHTWNNLIFPLIFIKKKELSTISVGLLSFFGERTTDYGAVTAATVITLLPPILMYVLLQEKVEKGLTAGAVKG